MTVPAILRSGPVLTIVVIAAALGIGQLLVAGLLSTGEATGHARLHAMTAVLLLAVAGVVSARWRSAGLVASLPALGLLLFAAAQLTESIGAYGFDASNEQRINELARIHDLSVVASSVGLMAMVLSIGAGLIVAAGRRSGTARTIGLASAMATLIGSLFLVKTMVGL